MTQAYPLQWPDGWTRTPKHKRENGRSRFRRGDGSSTTIASTRTELVDELQRLGARNVVLSTNVELRLDGLPYSNRRDPDDPGIAVYFTLDGESMVMKSHRVYTVEDIKPLFKVSRNTVSNWVGEGLIPSGGKRPYVFRGALIKHFHEQRIARSKINLRPDEFKCTGCKAAVFPDIATVKDNHPNAGRHMFSAVCPDCGAAIYKLPNAADCDIIEDCRNPNTTRQRM